MKIWLKIALNAVRLPKFEPVNGKSWSLWKMMVKDLRQRSGLAWFCARAESCVVFNTRPYTVLPDIFILITANMQSETGFPSSHQLNSTSPPSPTWNWWHALSCQWMLAFLFCLLRLRCYKAKCVKTRCLQEWVGHLEPKFQGEGVIPGEYFFGFYKTRHILLSNGANCTVLHAVVLTQYRRVTDGRTDGRTELP